jgi:soluble lytic murein transglycosylase-like protein
MVKGSRFLSWGRVAAQGLFVALVCVPAGADTMCAYRTESGALVYTNTPTKDGVCASASVAPPIGAVPDSQVSRYDTPIKSWALHYGVSARLVHAVVATESAYNPAALSPKGARGLMQLMPATARRYGVTDSFDAEQNIRGGVAHLRDLLDAFGGDTRLAVAAYNAGAGAVQKYSGVPPYAETRHYVGSVLGRLRGRVTGLTRPSAAPIQSASVRLRIDPAGSVSLIN